MGLAIGYGAVGLAMGLAIGSGAVVLWGYRAGYRFWGYGVMGPWFYGAVVLWGWIWDCGAGYGAMGLAMGLWGCGAGYRF